MIRAHLSGRARQLFDDVLPAFNRMSVPSPRAFAGTNVEKSSRPLSGPAPFFRGYFMPPQSFISLITPTSTHNGLDFGNWTTDSEWNSIIRKPKEIPCVEMPSSSFPFLLLYVMARFYNFELNRLGDIYEYSPYHLFLFTKCVYFMIS